MKLDRGYYAVFEGSDGSGKTTTMISVADALDVRLRDMDLEFDHITMTSHPGSTPLGAHIRQLVKHPALFGDDITMDELSRQMLYMVDTVNFVRSVLEPALDNNKIVFADRNSYISGVVYGLVDGCNLNEITKLYDIVRPPRMDKMFVLYSPPEVCKKRKAHEQLDHYDNQTVEFFGKVGDLYENLITTSAELTALVADYVDVSDIIYIDSTSPKHYVVDKIVDILFDDIFQRCVAKAAK